MKPFLSDRQRIELAIPPYFLYALTAVPGAFVPAGDAWVARADADIAELRAGLHTACLEPLADLNPQKRQAMMRRLERTGKGVMMGWEGQPALSVMLALWYFLKDLTDREVLILWEGSAMERATRKLLPMFEHGFDEQKRDTDAQGRAVRLLAHLQAEGLYR
ncbi:hypothetical protein [uncultured Methylobacterium sp.]|uniref:hypothetical protein n=1 Tax=uncultured Methylobacterium sp. TaxID=157278 RepID=UPI002596F546|nr:hypothetical protein [uncultured Methylobacterium sp.]